MCMYVYISPDRGGWRSRGFWVEVVPVLKKIHLLTSGVRKMFRVRMVRDLGEQTVCVTQT